NTKILLLTKYNAMKKVFLIVTLGIISSALFAQNAEELFNKAESKARGGNFEEAIDLYTSAINADPEYENAYLRRAFAYINIKDYEKAVADYTAIIKNNPDHTFAYLSRGGAYNKLEKYKEAMADFDKVLEIEQGGLQAQEAYNNRGWSKKALGDKAGACEDWKKSKKIGNAEAKLILKNNHCK
ncbi:MAG: tetratricopeptide repeat protein, partial [Bacteroidetes bacterium]|nr:tetratricopeptide repeat protein [Bacteroidota bacterium]